MPVIGLDKLLKRFEEIEKAVEDGTEAALEQFGVIVQEDAKRYCPVDTGRLQGSIKSKVENNTVIVGTDVEYAAYVEFGTSRQRPQPYLTPAFEQNKRKLKDLVAKEIEDRL